MKYSPKPVVKQKLNQKIMMQLLKSINNGEIKSGDRIPPEKELALKLNVSRTSLREALKAMEILGIVQSRVGRGTCIEDNLSRNVHNKTIEILSMLDIPLPLDILKAREILEIGIVNSAALNANNEDLKNIKDVLDKIKERIKREEKWLDLDFQFHLLLAESTHNSILTQLLNYLLNLDKMKVWELVTAIILAKPGQSQIYFDEHISIYNAIKGKNPEKALVAMMKHLKRVKHDISILNNK